MDLSKAMIIIGFSLVTASCATTAAEDGIASGHITGYIDGNAITDIPYDEAVASGFEYGDIITLSAGELSIAMPVCHSGEEVDSGMDYALLTENGITLSVNGGSFEGKHNIGEDMEITLSISEKAGYLEEYCRRNLIRFPERSSYGSDEAYADFRASIPDKLYRSISPIEGTLPSLTADSLIAEYGIASAINLSDTEDEMAVKAGNGVSYSEIENTIALGMHDDFQQKAEEAVRFINAHQAPYLIFSNDPEETARMIAFLEALGGMNIKLIVQDYMRTYMDSCGVQPGSEQYQEISDELLNFFISINGRPFPWNQLQLACKVYAETQLRLSDSEISRFISIMAL